LAGFHDELLDKSGLRIHGSSFGCAAGRFYHRAVNAGDPTRTTRILVQAPVRVRRQLGRGLEQVPATLAPVMRASLRRWLQPCQDRDVCP
jgi:hypothetical protein